MSAPGGILRRQLLATLLRPWRLLNVFRQDARIDWLRSLLREVDRAVAWRTRGARAGIEARRYASYEDYVRHQGSKLGTIDPEVLAEYDRTYREALRARLEALPFVKRGENVPCLGARIGTEVKAFQDAGCFAVGIDLNPGPSNRYVLYGDFHDLAAPDGAVDVVFTNSLDHAFDLPRLLREVRRVLPADGYFLVEAHSGTEEGGHRGSHEATVWRRVDDLVAAIESAGFRLLGRDRYPEPFAGERMIFQRPGGNQS